MNNQPDPAFQAIMQKYNYTPPASSGQPKDWYHQVQDKVSADTQIQQTQTDKENNPITSGLGVGAPGGIGAVDATKLVVPAVKGFADYSNNLLDKTSQPLADAAQKVTEDVNNSSSGKENPLSAGVDVAGDLAGGVTGAVGGAINAGVVEPIANAASSLPGMDAIATSKYSVASALLDEMDSAGKYLGDKWNQLATTHPDVAKKLSDAGNIAQFMTLFAGDNPELQKAAGTVADAVGQGLTDTAGKVGDVVGKVDTSLSDAAGAVKSKVTGKTVNPIQDSIDAVNPDLTGRKLTNAYKQTVTGSRDVTGGSIFKEQGLTPDQQSINLGTRLQDLKLGTDPIENLNKLKTGFSDAETKLNVELDKNPDIPTDRDTLLQSLDKGKTQALPREFKGIKGSSKAFRDVIDFSKEIIDASKDNFKGLREARTEFDTQAKTEYPNAFKDGSVDVKSPAGRAIKYVRDTMNEHLYNTAPNGSEIQRLIGREADIYRATDTVAEKAAQTHGKTGLEQTIDSHPVLKAGVNTIKKVIPYGVGSHLP